MSPKEIHSVTLTTNTIRGKMWINFSGEVLDHIDAYTIPQYGDFPKDLAATWDEAQVIKEVEKYLHRIKSAMRPDCRYTDLLKMSHYLCMLYHIRKREDKEINGL